MRILHAEPDEELDAELLAHVQRVVRTRIKALRDREGLTQGEAAARIGRRQWYWSRLEGGRVVLNVGHLLEVQSALELDSLEALFGSLPSAKAGRGEMPD